VATHDDGEREIQRSVIEAMMTNPERIKGARARLGKRGVKLYAVRRNSPFAKAGLRNGDVLTAANGMDLSSPDSILEALGVLGGADNVELTVLRGDEEVRLRYVIR
jgi:general secretion pathway protein C